MGLCTGGTFYYHADPWLSFASDGSLFQIGLPWSWPGPPGPVPEGFEDAVALYSSTDGGFTWNQPVVITASNYPDWGDDKPSVTVDELVTMVNVALGSAEVSACLSGDGNIDGEITVDEIIAAVNRALSECGVLNVE